MDNEAFRALVQERAKVKSTKEIAREAVEEEFQTRKKRKRRGSSSSEEDAPLRRRGNGDDDSDAEEPGAAHRAHEQQQRQEANRKKTRKPTSESKYRDRARERREGKNVDYEAQTSLLEGVASAASQDGEMDQVTMSKYLGGDEEHTHLVKGLDVALARRIKRDINKESREGRAVKSSLPAPEESPSDEKQSAEGVVVSDAEEALALLQRIKPGTVESDLGRQMLTHLKNVHFAPHDLSDLSVGISAAGFALQRSNLTFASFGDPRDRNRSWELPLESMQTRSKSGDRDASGTIGTNGSILLDAALVRRLRDAFSRRSDHSADRRRHTGSVYGLESQKETEEDDDIFDDIDGDYVPPTKAESKCSSLPAKTCNALFEGLVEVSKCAPSQILASHVSPSCPQKSATGATAHIVMPRHVPGSMSQTSSIANPKMGVSMMYEGGYGEEVDVDFDGRFAMEDDEDGKANKRGSNKRNCPTQEDERNSVGN